MKDNKKILLVDDDEGILDAVSMVLEDTGYQVDICSDSKKIYTKIHKNPPDLILLDLLLSGQDGREIYKKLKNDNKTKNIPVVIISAHHQGKRSINLSQLDSFLAKPFEREELIRKIAEYIHE
ncbi:MAG TPA: response regulator [Candidatus Eisenbacteria bacterium]|nr:response regulator [Candidatus Eisenbacteria bacterium]